MNSHPILPSQTRQVHGFGRSTAAVSDVYRPEKSAQLAQLCININKPMIAVGQRLSYGDSCLSSTLVDTTRLNRWLNLDNHRSLMTLEPGTTFNDFFSHPLPLMPAVIPGTLRATLGGAIAHDVHGKNQAQQGCFGSHVQWIDLCAHGGCQRVSPSEHPSLFYATIGGLGLTGIIKQLSIRLVPRADYIAARCQAFETLTTALEQLQTQSIETPYQAVWADLLHGDRAVLLTGEPTDAPLHPVSQRRRYQFLPFTMPFTLINRMTLKALNYLMWRGYQTQSSPQIKRFASFNNPLDAVSHWQSAYGRRGLLQCQWVIPCAVTDDFIKDMRKLFNKYQATPALAVVKAFGQSGTGLLSFAQPGFTFAVDFSHCDKHRRTVLALHELIIAAGGRVYLAKDTLLNQQHFETMYPQHQQFRQVLADYQLTNHCRSKLSQRLGLSL